MEREDRSLELTGDALRELIDDAASRIVAHVDSLGAQNGRVDVIRSV